MTYLLLSGIYRRNTTCLNHTDVDLNESREGDLWVPTDLNPGFLSVASVAKSSSLRLKLSNILLNVVIRRTREDVSFAILGTRRCSENKTIQNRSIKNRTTITIILILIKPPGSIQNDDENPLKGFLMQVTFKIPILKYLSDQ